MRVMPCALAALLALAAVACGVAAGGTPPAATPTPAATVTPSGEISPTEVRYLLLEEFELFFCDPHAYPVAREEEETRQALEQFPVIKADVEEFDAIQRHNGLTGVSQLSDEQKLLVFREHKRLHAVTLEPMPGGYKFQMRIQEENEGFAIQGTVTPRGQVTVIQREPSINTCPICLAPGMRIATPLGEVPVQDLREGMPVWTQDASGNRLAVPVVRVGSMPAPAGHQVVRVRLDDGRKLTASPGHPTADGRPLSALRPGDLLDGGRVEAVEWLPYQEAATFDILPGGGTGLYWANGTLLGSTLFSAAGG